MAGAADRARGRGTGSAFDRAADSRAFDGGLVAVAIDLRRDAVAEGHRDLDIPDPLLADMAIHHVDLLRFVLGREPLEVIARSWNPVGSPFRHDASAVLVAIFEGGLVASWRGSWLSRGPATPWAGEWVIEAEAGQIEWTCRGNAGARLAADRLAIRRPGGTAEPQTLAPVPFADRAGTVAAFARGRRRPPGAGLSDRRRQSRQPGARRGGGPLGGGRGRARPRPRPPRRGRRSTTSMRSPR